MQYKFYFYDGVPTAERRSADSEGEGIFSEVLNFDSPSSAIMYAADTVYEMNEGIDFEFESDVDAREYLDSIDTGDGSAFCIAIKQGAAFVYGDQEIFSYMCNESAQCNIEDTTDANYKKEDDKVEEAVTISGLDDILSDPAFKEVIDLITSRYRRDDVKISKHSVGQDSVDIYIEFDDMVRDLEDDMFYEQSEYYDEYDRPYSEGAHLRDVALEDLIEGVEEGFMQTIPVEDDGMYECSSCEYKVNVEIIDTYHEGEPVLYITHIPGRMYMSNGDPGYPDEYDSEIEGDLIITLRVRLTKII